MREVPIFAHTNGAVLVDANELNWLMNKTTEPEPRIVDVDSWQLGAKWPARVIMPSIRDWHTHGFNEQSDWFSWGIVTFQVFSGIHPYRGRHDQYTEREPLERRMKDNVSVFNKGVHLNAAVRDFSAIPGRLLGWYEAAFESGNRSEPPPPLDMTRMPAVARQIRQTVTASGSLVFEMILERGISSVVRVYPCGIALRENGSLIDLATKRYLSPPIMFGKPLSPRTEIVKTAKGYLIADRMKFYYTTEDWVDLPVTRNYQGVLRSGNRLFLITDGTLTELNLIDMGSNPVLRCRCAKRARCQVFGIAVRRSVSRFYQSIRT